MARQAFKARKQESLVARELGDEFVIYDTEGDHCHVLNPAAAIAWKHCGEAATIDEIAAAIAAGTDLPADPDVACLALVELKKAGLLEGAASIPPPSAAPSDNAPSPAMAVSPTTAPEPPSTTTTIAPMLTTTAAE